MIIIEMIIVIIVDGFVNWVVLARVSSELWGFHWVVGWVSNLIMI